MKSIKFSAAKLLVGLALTIGLSSQAAVTQLTWSTSTDFTDTDPANNSALFDKGSLPALNLSSAQLVAVGTGNTTGRAAGDLVINGTGGATLQYVLTATGAGARISSLGYDYFNRGTGHPTQIAWSYSIDGVTNSLGNTALSGASGTESLTFTTPITVSASQTINVIGSLSPWTSTSPLYFDNVEIGVEPVPEPVSVALAGFGFIAISVGFVRKLYKGRK
jgi:hypothetical protein